MNAFAAFIKTLSICCEFVNAIIPQNRIVHSLKYVKRCIFHRLNDWDVSPVKMDKNRYHTKIASNWITARSSSRRSNVDDCSWTKLQFADQTSDHWPHGTRFSITSFPQKVKLLSLRRVALNWILVKETGKKCFFYLFSHCVLQFLPTMCCKLLLAWTADSVTWSVLAGWS